MSGKAVTCPNCSGTLALTSWTPGRQLRCPRCTTVFQLGPDPGRATPVALDPVMPTAPVRPPVPIAGGNRVPLLIGVVAVLVLFVGGTIGLAVLAARAEKKPEPAPVASTSTRPNPNPIPLPIPIPIPGPAPVEPVVVPPPPGRALPPELQEKVDRAIEKGLAYIKSHGNQGENGSAFLYALTLLECGAAPDEPPLVNLTRIIREYASSPRATQTYNISLALLYLDRLGDRADRPLIRKLGLRLMAGQLPGGGWAYLCPYFSDEVERAMLAALDASRPEMAMELALSDGKGQLLGIDGRFSKEDRLDAVSIKSLETGRNKLARVQADLAKFPQLKQVPSLQFTAPPAGNPNQPQAPRLNLGRDGDNSNTQFAALGLWVASRHDVPCERSLALLSSRFRTSQGSSGGWAYHAHGGSETPAMTCAGLLALAIGHGIRLEDTEEKRDDPQIQKGLAYLARSLERGDHLARNLYFLWSLERVGVLFGLDKVGEVDWHEWGAKRLVESQSAGGSWVLRGYHGSDALHDTCFALLFLKKANFVRDLSRKLDRVLNIKSAPRESSP